MLLEDGKQVSLHAIGIMYNDPGQSLWGTLLVHFLVEKIPEDKDIRALNEVIDRSPSWRIASHLEQFALFLGKPRDDEIVWIVGTRPMIIAVGKIPEGVPQRYPHDNVRFGHANDGSTFVQRIEVAEISDRLVDRDYAPIPPRRVKTIILEKPCTIAEVYRLQPWANPRFQEERLPPFVQD